jgi:hypothetical protein
VLWCRTHRCAFTLYPPAFAPYRRQAVLRVAPDGQPIRGEGDPQQTDFGGTVFEAALDAKRGQPWARESGMGAQERWWGTQGRHLRLGARLAGVARDLSDRVRCSIATVLSVATLQLIEGARGGGLPRARRGGLRRAQAAEGWSAPGTAASALRPPDRELGRAAALGCRAPVPGALAVPGLRNGGDAPGLSGAPAHRRMWDLGAPPIDP